MPNIETDLFQLFGHAWAAVVAQVETGLFLDVRQRDQIRSLPAADRTVARGAQAARTDIYDMAHPANG